MGALLAVTSAVKVLHFEQTQSYPITGREQCNTTNTHYWFHWPRAHTTNHHRSTAPTASDTLWHDAKSSSSVSFSHSSPCHWKRCNTEPFPVNTMSFVRGQSSPGRGPTGVYFTFRFSACLQLTKKVFKTQADKPKKRENLQMKRRNSKS